MSAPSSGMTKVRWLVLVTIALLAGVIALAFVLRTETDGTASDSPLIGQPAPDFSLPMLGAPDRRLGNRDLLGEPFLLHAWRSDCEACRAEQPVLAHLSSETRVRVVGLNLGDAPDDARVFLERFGHPYWTSVIDIDGRAARDWGIHDAPETFLVDARGIVRWKFVGPLTMEVVAADIVPTLESAR